MQSAATKGGAPQLAPGTLRLLQKMQRSGRIEDRLLAQRLVMEAKRSRLKLETEAQQMLDATFVPNLARSPPDRRVDVAALSQRLHDAAVDRRERHRVLQVSSRGPQRVVCCMAVCDTRPKRALACARCPKRAPACIRCVPGDIHRILQVSSPLKHRDSKSVSLACVSQGPQRHGASYVSVHAKCQAAELFLTAARAGRGGAAGAGVPPGPRLRCPRRRRPPRPLRPRRRSAVARPAPGEGLEVRAEGPRRAVGQRGPEALWGPSRLHGGVSQHLIERESRERERVESRALGAYRGAGGGPSRFLPSRVPAYPSHHLSESPRV